MQVLRLILPTLIHFLVRVLAFTMRFRVIDRAGMSRDQVHRPVIWVFWHQNILVTTVAYLKFFSSRHGYCLTSPSKDGEIVADVMARFGVGSVRGSSSRRGAAAVREMAAVLEKGGDIVITPDGPRGPKHTLNPGVIKLAQVTGAPVVPISVKYSRCWQLKTWDSFCIPKPFSKVTLFVDALHEIPRENDPSAFEAERARLELALSEPDLDS